MPDALRQRMIAHDPRRLAHWYERGYVAGRSLTVGLEEELILVDADSLLPADEIEWVLAALGGDLRAKAELRACQLELCTPVCVTAADAGRELAAARADVLAQVAGVLRLLAVGTHPAAVGPTTVTARERFHGVAAECGWAIRRGQPSGLHVHVGLDDPVEALAVYNAARSYLPEVGALAANSPFFEGGASGLASTRLKLTEDLSRSGIPPAFGSWRELAEFVCWGRWGGLFSDLSYLWWDLRPRPDYGTLELRIADVQTRPAEAAAIAAFCQSLVAWLAARFRRGELLPVHEAYRITENRWRALRDGLEAHLVDLDSGAAEPARDRIARLLLELEAHADELGCADELGRVWALLRENGASRQREIAARHGLRGLLAWLADETERTLPVGRDRLIVAPHTAAVAAAKIAG